VQRKLAMVWNMYDFFTMYAEVDGWEWDGKLTDPGATLSNPLDQWIVSRVHQLTEHINKHMEAYDLPNAMSEILPFLDDASNWYVRRSRRRFWKSGDDADKQNAYRTLHYILVQFAMTVAPFTPFLAEELFLKLTGGELGESVHLLDWPETGHVNELALEKMAFARRVINEGLSQRAAAKIKARQPLASVSFSGAPQAFKDVEAEYEQIIAEELNVKKVSYDLGEHDQFKVALDLKLTPELKREGQMREVIRFVQTARKAAGLNVDDRIVLSLQTEDKQLQQAIDEHKATIAGETLAASLQADKALREGFSQQVTVEGAPLSISLQKSA